MHGLPSHSNSIARITPVPTKMMFCGFAEFVILFASSGLILVESSSIPRKVIVKEIRFTVGAKDLPFNISVKNGADNEANAPVTTLYNVGTIKGTENERILVEKYHKLLQEDPFLKESTRVKRRSGNIRSMLQESVKMPSRDKTVDQDNKHSETAKPNDNEQTDGKGSKERDKHENNEKMNVLAQSESTKSDTSQIGENAPTLMIVGGTLSLPTTWPWQVSIQYFGADNYWHHFCGGSLIHMRWVVTAAHCVSQLEDYTIRIVLGDYRLSVQTYREQVIDPERILMHAYYEDTSYYFDIAMVKLAESAISSTYVQTVEMATPKIDTFSSNDLCYITGWGNTIGTTERVSMSDYLLQSQVAVMSKSSCRLVYGHIIEDTHVCITGENVSACSGDSGGPLVCQANKGWKLVGITSWVGSATCSPEYPNVYTRMSAFYEWAISVMEQY